MADQGPTQVGLPIIKSGAAKKLIQAGKIGRYGNVERFHRRRIRRTQKANKVELRRAAVKFRQAHFVVETCRIAPLHRAERDAGERGFKPEHRGGIIRCPCLGFAQQFENTRNVGLVLVTQFNRLIILAFVVPFFR